MKILKYYFIQAFLETSMMIALIKMGIGFPNSEAYNNSSGEGVGELFIGIIIDFQIGKSVIGIVPYFLLSFIIYKFIGDKFSSVSGSIVNLIVSTTLIIFTLILSVMITGIHGFHFYLNPLIAVPATGIFLVLLIGLFTSLKLKFEGTNDLENDIDD